MPPRTRPQPSPASVSAAGRETARPRPVPEHDEIYARIHACWEVLEEVIEGLNEKVSGLLQARKTMFTDHGTLFDEEDRQLVQDALDAKTRLLARYEEFRQTSVDQIEDLYRRLKERERVILSVEENLAAADPDLITAMANKHVTLREVILSRVGALEAQMQGIAAGRSPGPGPRVNAA